MSCRCYCCSGLNCIPKYVDDFSVFAQADCKTETCTDVQMLNGVFGGKVRAEFIPNSFNNGVVNNGNGIPLKYFIIAGVGALIFFGIIIGLIIKIVRRRKQAGIGPNQCKTPIKVNYFLNKNTADNGTQPSYQHQPPNYQQTSYPPNTSDNYVSYPPNGYQQNSYPPPSNAYPPPSSAYPPPSGNYPPPSEPYGNIQRLGNGGLLGKNNIGGLFGKKNNGGLFGKNNTGTGMATGGAALGVGAAAGLVGGAALGHALSGGHHSHYGHNDYGNDYDRGYGMESHNYTSNVGDTYAVESYDY
ncbi:hypothetical protein HDU92_005184 [Lobulomyces angularis]|nr:hypothetical protein HDU92_005184 [Lobulomyces angularis]